MTKASLIVIGSELTRGIIQDKHTILVSHELSKMGIHFSESVVIPDDGTIREVIGALLRNNDIVLLTGGLGPTTDDMTRSAIAEAAGVELVRDEGAWNHLLETLKDRAYGANEKQAYIPKGFNLIPNPNGTAPGFWGEVKGTLVVSMPGPPREMEPMFENYVKNRLYKIHQFMSELVDEAIACGEIVTAIKPTHVAFTLEGIIMFFFLTQGQIRQIGNFDQRSETAYLMEALDSYLSSLSR